MQLSPIFFPFLHLFPINSILDYSYFIQQIVLPDSALGLLQLRPHAAHQLHHVRILTKRNEEAEQTVLNLWGSAKMVFRGADPVCDSRFDNIRNL